MKVFTIAIVPVVIEALISYVNMFIKKDENGKRTIYWEILASAVIGVAIALSFNADIFTYLGVDTIPYVGTILTGIIFSRGSNYAFDILEKIVWSKANIEDILDPLNDGSHEAPGEG